MTPGGRTKNRDLTRFLLLNLARNGLQAMQASPEPRILHLQARLHSPQAIEFAVTDTGIGIAPEVAQRLFTPFFTTKDEGMGLGLSLCRSVLEQHGSTLRHQPHLPRGTRFSFTLPVARSIL